MGKKLQGAKLRAMKRSKEASLVIQESQADQIASLPVTSKSDADLFVVDTTGEKVPHHKRPVKVKHVKPTGLSAQDQKQVDSLLKKHGAEKMKEIAAKGRKVLESHKRRTSAAAHKTHTSFDLWDAPTDNNDNSNVNINMSKSAAKKASIVNAKESGDSGIGSTLAGTSAAHLVIKGAKLQRVSRKPILTTVAVDVAEPGQSYHPDPVQHKALIKKAAAVEIARNAAVLDIAAPLSQGLSAETKAMMLGDSDDEASSDEDEDKEFSAVGAIPKRANKLTRAQRNKQKRLRVVEAIQKKAKKNKKLNNEVSEIGRYNNERKKQVKTDAQKQEEKLAILQAKAAIPRGKNVELKQAQQDPINFPTVPVALSTELRSSLRTLKPKGSLATDRVISMADRSQITKRSNAEDAEKKRRQSKKRRKLSVKGKFNRDALGSNFEILG